MRRKLILLFIIITASPLLSCDCGLRPPPDAPSAIKIPAGKITPYGVPGTEDPRVFKCPPGKADNIHSGTAYLYKAYEVLTEPAPGHPGQNIFIYRPDVSGGNPCELDKRKASYIIDTLVFGGTNFFSGMYGQYLFIDQGTGHDHKTLSVYDLEQRELVLFVPHYSGTAVVGGVLVYQVDTLTGEEAKEAAKTTPCPMAEEWIHQGISTTYERTLTYNLNSDIQESTSVIKCTKGEKLNPSP